MRSINLTAQTFATYDEYRLHNPKNKYPSPLIPKEELSNDRNIFLAVWVWPSKLFKINNRNSNFPIFRVMLQIGKVPLLPSRLTRRPKIIKLSAEPFEEAGHEAKRSNTIKIWFNEMLIRMGITVTRHTWMNRYETIDIQYLWLRNTLLSGRRLLHCDYISGSIDREEETRNRKTGLLWKKDAVRFADNFGESFQRLAKWWKRENSYSENWRVLGW